MPPVVSTSRALGRELLDRLRDRVALVGHDLAHDLEAVGGEELVEQVAARVLPRAHVHAVRDRENGRLHTGSFVFSTSLTSETTIPSSTAFAMS